MSGRHMMRLHNWLLSSPPAEYALNILRELLIGALRQGPIPKHIAFVMDGNRRYAKHNRIETVEGHNLGFEALARILEVCYKTGVTHVTIYAFSIENFKRSQYEVDALMNMAKTKLQQLSQHGDILERYGAHIRVLGERSFLKPDVLEVIDRAVEMSSMYEGKCVLNVCFPYTSRLEITTAVRETVAEFCKPISPSTAGNDRQSPFKKERIANTIRTHHLSEHSTLGGDDDDNDNSLNSESTLPLIAAKQRPPAAAVSEKGSSLDPQSPPSPSLSTTSASSSQHTFQSDSASHDASSTTSAPFSLPPSQTPPVSKSLRFKEPQYPSPETITPATITSHLYTADNPPVDLLIRTSGVSRLSDFMLWQCHQDTDVVFLDVLWPDFDLWSFLPVLWGWQWRVRKETSQKSEAEAEAEARKVRIGTLRKAMKAA
ncbi:hypothetical protein DV736_g6634, partial [Chaetothyriales sp. CBS 134916]